MHPTYTSGAVTLNVVVEKDGCLFALALLQIEQQIVRFFHMLLFVNCSSDLHYHL